MSLFTPKDIEFTNYLDRTKFLLIWRLSIVFVILMAILSITFSFDASSAVYSYLIGLAICSFAVIYLYKTKKYRFPFFFYSIIGSLIIQVDMNLVLDSPHYGNFMWIVVINVLCFFGLGMKWGFSILGLNVLGIIYFLFFTMDEHYEKMKAIVITNKIAVSIEIAISMFVVGYLIYLFNKLQSIAEHELIEKNLELESQNHIVQQQNKEKTILVKEIHHRVKNNLQIIISLLRLQMTDIKSAEAKKHFTEAINRVMVMSSIHQKLYQEKDITQFSLSVYIVELANELKQFFKEKFPIEINVDSDFEDIDLKTVVPVGLILNELFSNSLKYAFENKDFGRINVKIENHKEHFILHYVDNGEWKVPDSDNTGFGVELIQVLTEQLNGTKEFIGNENGTSYIFNLKKLSD